uniref:KRAB domain-containing protein n=1 Tax=Spermophilus dauricus TaxID=99837 RepID=A0A8C9QLX4_SPEDA
TFINTDAWVPGIVIVLLQVSVSFKDVTINFNWEKWQHLDSAQEYLYWDVTLGNYHHLASIKLFSSLITQPQV